MAMPPPPPAPPMSHSRFEEGLRPGGPPNDEVSGFVVFMNVISTVTHLLLGGVAVTAFIAINAISNLSFRTLTAHVYISVIGYVLLLSQAVLSFNPHMGWANNFKYPQKRKIYWIIQVVGSTMAVIGGALGIAAVEKYANSGVPSLPDWFPIPIVIEKYSHLSTSHGIVGLIAMVLAAVSLVGAIVHLACSDMVNSVMLRAVYSCITTLTFILAFIAICIAFEDFRGILQDSNSNLAIAFTVLALMGLLGMMGGNLSVRGSVSMYS